MNLYKRFLAVFIALLATLSIVSPVKADRLEDLKKAVAHAEVKLSHAKANLYIVNRTAYKIFMEQPWTEEFQQTERFLRENYPNAYWGYIIAKGELEELKELLFTATMNDIKAEE